MIGVWWKHGAWRSLGTCTLSSEIWVVLLMNVTGLSKLTALSSDPGIGSVLSGQPRQKPNDKHTSL